jgi:hypothetical protein
MANSQRGWEKTAFYKTLSESKTKAELLSMCLKLLDLDAEEKADVENEKREQNGETLAQQLLPCFQFWSLFRGTAMRQCEYAAFSFLRFKGCRR